MSLAEGDRLAQIERALRQSLRDLEHKDGELRDSEHRLQTISDALPILVSYIDDQWRYRFANAAYERWFGRPRAEFVGRPVRELLGDEVSEQLRPHLEAALAGRVANYQMHAAYRHGGQRFVEATYIPDFDGEHRVRGVVALVTDITQRKHLEDARIEMGRQTAQLMKITASIAEAVTRDEVLRAVVDEVAATIDATSASLFMMAPDQRTVDVVRAYGLAETTLAEIGGAPIDGLVRFPAIDAIRGREPIWLASRAEIDARYPDLASAAIPEGTRAVACLPLALEGRTVGALALTFEEASGFDDDERNFLLLVARASGQALERVRLLDAEQKERVRAELLYGLARVVIGAERPEQLFDAALSAIERGLDTTRSAVLVFDDEGIMRFRAWRGLSARYRQAVEGHSPWSREARDPKPILVADVETEGSLAEYRATFRDEGIRALAFIPLVADGVLLGKFMVYYPRPRELGSHEVEMANAIGNHVAAGISRFSALAELRDTVRFNEMFMGILGHDLRNPLTAILTAAQLATKQDGSERLFKPLSRILSSSERMGRMIEQLLDFTRVRVGQGIPLELCRLDLVPVVRQVMEELDDANPDWTLHLERVGNTEGVWDADRLSQVFSNLIANAVQHGIPEHGVRVRIDGTDDWVVQVEVRNMGVIPAEVVGKLFEPMVRAGQGRDKSRGLGLGLYITHEILRAHGARIEVESAAETGTMFKVVLPRATPRPRPPHHGAGE